MSFAAAITALGHALGPHVVENAELEQHLGLEPGFIAQRTGIARRPWLNPGQAPSELGAAAVAALGLTAPPDWLLCATSTPERLLPPTGSSVMARLGWRGTMTLDISAGCMGFLTGLTLAEGLVLGGLAGRVVVLAQEAMSRILNPADHKTSVLFGDGAGAALVEKSDQAILRLGPAVHYTDPQQSGVLQVPGGGSLAPTTRETVDLGERFLHMDGGAVFRFAVATLPRMVREVCDKTGWAVGEVDQVFPHQSNLRILEGAAQALDLPMEKMTHHLADHGNLAAASIPVLLSERHRQGRLHSGEKLVLAAYGSGLAYGARAAVVAQAG